MAGMIFWRSGDNLDPNEVNEAFQSLDYSNGKHLFNSDWNAIIYQKSQYNIRNWIEFADGFICGSGTYSYKGRVYEEALPTIAGDLRNNKLDITKFWGSFIIFSVIDKKPVLIRDGAGLARLHKIKGKSIYSSSFAGLLRSNPFPLKINKESLLELLSTGLIVGSETIIQEIEFVNLSYTTKDINLIQTKPNQVPSPTSYQEAVKQQVDIADEFFKRVTNDWFNYNPESHFNISLTGGLDSRLVIAFVLNHQKRVDFYTYWKDDKDIEPDFRLAKVIAKELGLPLYFKETKYADQLDDNQIIEIFHDAHNSCDGVIRPGSYWDEEFSCSKYRIDLSPFPYLRMTGFGGEQYRNMERLPIHSRRSYENWIRWDMIYRWCGKSIENPKVIGDLESRIASKLEDVIGKGTYNLLSFKEYRRQVIKTNYRSLQTNMENRFGFLISPLADANLSIPARSAYPYMKDRLHFHLDMLNRVSPKISKLPSQYGFDLSRGEPLKLKVIDKIWKTLPSTIKYRALYSFRNNYENNFVHILSAKSVFVHSLIQKVRFLDLPINLDQLAKRNVNGKIILNLGFFLETNEKWLQ